MTMAAPWTSSSTWGADMADRTVLPVLFAVLTETFFGGKGHETENIMGPFANLDDAHDAVRERWRELDDGFHAVEAAYYQAHLPVSRVEEG
jgi:hypothetical protein